MELTTTAIRAGQSTGEAVTCLFSTNELLESCRIISFRQPPLLQQRLELTPDEARLVETAIGLRERYHLPFWDALLASSFDQGSQPLRLIDQAEYHQSGRQYSTLARRQVLDLVLVGLTLPSPDDLMVSLHSEFRYADCPLHLPMLDFHCQRGPENEVVVRRICANLFNSTYLLIASGQSYHAVSMELCTTDRFVTILSRALLYAPFIDKAYVAHQLIERGAALRINRTSHKPILPTVIDVISGS